MNNLTFGEVNWDSVDTNAGGPTGPRIPFLVMKDPGQYQIRIVSKPFQYYHHWINDISGAQKKVNCTADDSTCPVCKLGGKDNRAKPHWLFKVIDRTESAKEKKPVIKVLDCGNQILTAISDLNRDPNWGKVSQYDVTIKRGPKGRNPLYTVHPCPKTPITQDEIAALKATEVADSVTFIDLPRIGKAWTPEKISSVINGTNNAGASGTKPSVASDDLDFEDVGATAPAQQTPAASKSAGKATTTQSNANDVDFLDL
jgi:hypothetical protein